MTIYGTAAFRQEQRAREQQERTYRRGFYWGFRAALMAAGGNEGEVARLSYLSRLETWQHERGRSVVSGEPPHWTPTARDQFRLLIAKLAKRQPNG
jgi:hypothetical protein